MGFIRDLFREYWQDVKDVAFPFVKEHHLGGLLIHEFQGSQKLNEACFFPIYEVEKILDNKLVCRHGENTEVFYNDYNKTPIQVSSRQGSLKYPLNTKVVHSLKFDLKMTEDPYEIVGFALRGYVVVHLKTGLKYYVPDHGEYSQNLTDLFEPYSDQG